MTDTQKEFRFCVGGRYLRCLRFCPHCVRIEFMNEAGPFMWKCDECLQLVAKNL